MKNLLLLLTTALLVLASCTQKDKETYVEIETEFGTMKAVLYNSTPLHKENFVKLVSEGFYDGLIFHRVINKFMVQGGDPDSKEATPDQRLGGGGPGYQIDAEIGEPHYKGTLAAARTPNPQRKSSGSQFYIVHGDSVTAPMLEQAQRTHKQIYTEEQKADYIASGGYPWLDNEYTVFGRVVEGLDVIDKIAEVSCREDDNRPENDVKMTVRLIK